VRRPLRADEHADALSRLSPLVGCSRAELQAVARSSTRVTRRAGAVLVRQGTTVREFIVVASGVALAARDGSPDTVLQAGDWFGDAELLSKSGATATVFALTDVDVIAMSYPEFISLFDSVCSFRRRLVAALAARAVAFRPELAGVGDPRHASSAV